MIRAICSALACEIRRTLYHAIRLPRSAVRLAPLALLFAAAHAQAPPDTLRPPTDLITYGWSVDADDTWLLVGGREFPPPSAVLSDPKGTVFVYRLGDGVPTLAQRLHSDGIGNQDCYSWSMDIRGDLAVVGASCEYTAVQHGAVYIYRYDGSAWNREAKLVSTDLPNPTLVSYFGTSVSLGDGYLVVGADTANPADPQQDYQSGAAYVFEPAGGAWALTATLVNSDTEVQRLEHFGSALATADDPAGRTIMVGAYGESGVGAEARGAVYVFERQGETWAERAKLLCPGAGQSALCGELIGSGDGALAVASETAVYPLTREAGPWQIGEALTPPGFQTYGMARWGATIVALSQPSGAYPDQRHAALVFTETNGAWVQQPSRSVPIINQQTSIVVSANSTTLFLGRPASYPRPNYVLVERIDGTTAAEPAPASPLALTLAPNPTAGTARARFSTAAAGPARLVVSDALGRRVAEQDLGALGAGPHDVALGLGRLAPGVYIVRLATADGEASGRLVRQ